MITRRRLLTLVLGAAMTLSTAAPAAPQERNYLLGLDWDRKPPPPPLSAEIIRETSHRYLRSAEILTGRSPLGNGV